MQKLIQKIEEIASLGHTALDILEEECARRVESIIQKKIHDFFCIAACEGVPLEDAIHAVHHKQQEMLLGKTKTFLEKSGYTHPDGTLKRAHRRPEAGYTTIKQLYDEYLLYCASHGVQSMGRRPFRRSVESLGVRVWKQSNIVVDVVKDQR